MTAVKHYDWIDSISLIWWSVKLSGDLGSLCWILDLYAVRTVRTYRLSSLWNLTFNILMFCAVELFHFQLALYTCFDNKQCKGDIKSSTSQSSRVSEFDNRRATLVPSCLYDDRSHSRLLYFIRPCIRDICSDYISVVYAFETESIDITCEELLVTLHGQCIKKAF